MKITKIEASKSINKTNFVNIYIDGEFFCSIHANSVLKLKLSNNAEIDSTTLEKLRYQSIFDYVALRAIRHSQQRPHSEKEYRNYVSKILYNKSQYLDSKSSFDTKSIDTNQIQNDLVDWLKEKEYIDDVKFSEWFVEQRMNSHSPKGPNYIKQELLQKGVDMQIISNVLSNIDSDIETENLRKIALKQYKKIASKESNTYKQKGKLFSYLKSKGYKNEDIYTVIDSIISGI